MIINNRSYFHPLSLSFFSRVGQNNGGDLFPIEKNAIDFLIKQLFINNLWDKIIALYPMVGRNPISTSFNLINNNFTINWFGSLFFNYNGVKQNSSGYGNCNIPLNIINSNNFIFFSQCSDFVKDSNYHVIMGASGATRAGEKLLGLESTGAGGRLFGSSGANARYCLNGTDQNGFSAINSYSSLTGPSFFKNGLLNTSFTQNSTPNDTITRSIFIFCLNENGSTTNFSNLNLKCCGIGRSLSSSENYFLYKIIDDFQNILGR